MATRRRRRAETTVAAGHKRVRTTHLGSETESTEELDVQTFETDPAYVRVNVGTTKSIGEYESLRVDVSISMPCYKEEIETMIPKIADVAAEHLDEQIDLFMGTGE